jgi:hypothetical protein
MEFIKSVKTPLNIQEVYKNNPKKTKKKKKKKKKKRKRKGRDKKHWQNPKNIMKFKYPNITNPKDYYITLVALLPCLG